MMALCSIPDIRIAGIAAAVPEHTEYNSQLAVLPEKERPHLIRMIGIDHRRVAPAALCASDLCITAAKQLLQAASLAATDIGILVFVTQTPDYPMPGNSMLAQQQLGMPASSILLDLHQGCAGYVYGLMTISSLLQSAGSGYGLLLVGDTITRVLSPHDRSTLPIFSDAGSATLVQYAAGAGPFYFNLGADGKGADAICIKSGGARHPAGEKSFLPQGDASGILRAPVHMKMEGIDVLNYSMKHVVPNVNELLQYAGCDAAAVDYFVFHQANRILNESILKKTGVPAAKAPETLSVFGNTSSATIPITLSYRLGSVLAGGERRLLLSGFGVGFSWGSALVSMGPAVCPALIEMEKSYEE